MSEPTQSQSEAKRWEVPAIDGSDGRGFLTTGRLQELQEAAYDEAYQAGLKKGQAAGENEVKKRAIRFNKLLRALAHPFDELDEAIEKQLVELSMAVVNQLFRREIHIHPDRVIDVVHEAIQLLPVASRKIRIHLHPEDAKLVLESMPTKTVERAWDVVEDPMIGRGGCKVSSENSHIDAQAKTRLKAVIDAITRGGRQQ